MEFSSLIVITFCMWINWRQLGVSARIATMKYWNLSDRGQSSVDDGSSSRPPLENNSRIRGDWVQK